MKFDTDDIGGHDGIGIIENPDCDSMNYLDPSGQSLFQFVNKTVKGEEELPATALNNLIQPAVAVGWFNEGRILELSLIDHHTFDKDQQHWI